MNNTLHHFKFLFISLFIFLAIYQPPIFQFNIIHLLLIISAIGLVYYRRQIYLYLYKYQIIFYICLFINLLMYLTLFIINRNISFLYTQFVMCIEIQIIIYFSYIYISSNNLSIPKIIILCGLFQSILSISAFLFPKIQVTIIELCIRNGFPQETRWFIGKRFFGISSQLSFSMPILQSIIGIFTIERFIEFNKSKVYIIISLMMFFSAIINSRSSFIIIIVGLLYLFIKYRKKLRNMRINNVFILILFICISIFSLYIFNKNTFIWISEGLKEILLLFFGKKEGYFDTLFNEYLFFPNTFIKTLFGTGLNIFNSTDLRSDVGYIIDLWYIGILGCIVKYGIFFITFKKMIKKDTFFIYLIVVLLISNIKGIIIENNEVMVFISLWIIYTSFKIDSNCKLYNSNKKLLKKLELDEIQNIQINILQKIKPILEENNLRYSLAYGTLIGAVRHKGYIPWDYDIDICLPRKDYNKLISITKNKSYDNIEIKTNETDINYCIEFARAIDNTTIDNIGINPYFEQIGLFVDIYPIDYVSDNLSIYHKERKIVLSLIKLLRLITFYTENENISWIKKIIKKIIYCLGKDHISIVIKLINKIEEYYGNKSEKNKMSFVQDEDAEKAIFDSILFDQLMEVEFENELYKSFKDYDSYLSHIYGNYMQLPPIKDQVTRYEIDAYKIQGDQL